MTGSGGDLVRTVTSVRDGREHLVTEGAIHAGHEGRYVALCGYRMLAAALACPPGLLCSACAAIHDAPAIDNIPRRTRRRHQHRRMRWPRPWIRLVSRLRGRAGVPTHHSVPRHRAR